MQKQFWSLLEKYGCDFTNTFRVLSKVSKAKAMTPSDEQVLDGIVSYMVPKQGMLKTVKSQWAQQPKLLEIL